MSPTATTADWRAKYVEAADMLAEARAELDDFVHSSKELEEELLRELDRNEKVQKDLKDKVIAVEADRDNWKVRSSVFHIRSGELTLCRWLQSRFISLQTNYNTAVNSLNRELDTLRQEHQKVKVQLRELELGNDDLERTERAITSSLADTEAKYTQVLEEKILLEHELLVKASVEEECQRLRDELRDTNAENAIIKDQLENLKTVMSPGTPPATDPSPNPSTTTLPTTSNTDDEELLKTPPPGDLHLSCMSTVPDLGAVPAFRHPSGSRPTSRPSSSASSGQGRAALLSRAGFTQANPPTPTHGVNRAPPSSNSPSRLPAPRTSRVNGIPRPSLTPSSSAPNVTKSKGVQMVTEMRARVKTLEQKLHSRVPRGRQTSGYTSDLKEAQDRALTQTRNAQPVPASLGSPGWVLVMEETPPAKKPLVPSHQNQDGTPIRTTRLSIRSRAMSPTNGTTPPPPPIPVFKQPTSRPPSGGGGTGIPTPSKSRPTTPAFRPVPSTPSSISYKRQSHPQSSMPRRGMMQASSAKASEGVFTRARPAGATRGFSDHAPPVKGIGTNESAKPGTIPIQRTTMRTFLTGSKIGRPTSFDRKRTISSATLPAEKKEAHLVDEEGRLMSGTAS